jgi:4-hydroxy-3-methylbut-2-enyl diphosphate reductase
MDMAGAESGGASPVFTIGPLIHNPQALESLYRKGVAVLDEDKLPSDLGGNTLIVRAHGITPGLEEALKERGGRLVDATCPHVRASQLKALNLAREGYWVFLAGEKQHGEIIGIQGYVERGREALGVSGGHWPPGPACTVVANPAEAGEGAARLYAEDKNAPTALIAQTTISSPEYEKIGAAIEAYFPALVRVNTICGATRDRQDALRELCGKVQAVIIAGGRGSANTRRLLAIAAEEGLPAWLVETRADIPKEVFGYSVVGLSAGASTPDYIIQDIEDALRAGL